jgi:hypothetical protein
VDEEKERIGDFEGKWSKEVEFVRGDLLGWMI